MLNLLFMCLLLSPQHGLLDLIHSLERGTLVGPNDHLGMIIFDYYSRIDL